MTSNVTPIAGESVSAAGPTKWPLERVRVELRHETGPDGLVIDRRIELAGDLDAAQRERLLAIAGKCPVHKALTGPVEIRSALA